MELLKQGKDKFTKFLKGRYGIDELGRTIFLVSIIVYTIGVVVKNSIVALAGMIGLLIFVIRILSGDHWDRRAENKKYMAYEKLWKLRYENRKTAKIYMCEHCGRYIRVPKGKGKIQITCPDCRNRMIRNT
jgi:DNA-directed RNA polymerase subunit RPC12/RpoP